MNVYFDIETLGLDYKKDKIISIQYQELNFNGTINPEKPLIILKEWESSEEEIVKKFYDIFKIHEKWACVPVGFNTHFDLIFLWNKFKQYNLPINFDFMEWIFGGIKPIDLQCSFIIANNLSFRGSSLDKMTNKEQDGKSVPIWYANKEYDKIEKYIVQETDSFLKVLSILREDLNISKQKWKTSWKDRHPNNIHSETSAHSPSG